jgi:quercetin dioxygenase-like cupin family protein
MSGYNLDDLPEREVFPGFHGRFVHSDAMTFAYWNIDMGAEVPAHSHPHEQVVNMLAGELELTVAGIPYRLRAGDVFPIRGDVEHAARALTACRVLDVFTPVRDDYRDPPTDAG